jgi:hypothetical protein
LGEKNERMSLSGALSEMTRRLTNASLAVKNNV